MEPYELEQLDDVVFMGRPVFGQADSKVSLFKIEPDGKYANRVQVDAGARIGEYHRSAHRAECGRPGDPVGYVGLGRITSE